MDLCKAYFFLGTLTGIVLGTDIVGYAKLEGPWSLSLQKKAVYFANTVAECAAKCNSETSFSCRAFSYTDNDQTCWIAWNIQSETISHKTSAALYNKIEECMHCRGEDYRGQISFTKSGFRCQRWDSQTPHNHNNTSSRYPEKDLVENYCRNPDSEPGPWCYTTSESKRWELCRIPRCTSESPIIVPEMTCFSGKGKAYRGTTAVTESGKTCQNWWSRLPHKHTRTPINYPCKGLERNYCRNPDDEDKPWCYTTDPDTRWEYCNVSICGHEPGPEECIHCVGEDYRGQISNTESGLTCQRWDSQTPHNHDTSSTYPGENLVENYCRNPGGREPRPWCFTSSESKRWEYCPIPRCSTSSSSSEPPTITPEMTCITGKGVAYRGTIAVTESGKTCQSWSSQRPHQHSHTPENYSCKGLERNYCRNPNNEDHPWCYTTDPDTLWEYCNVPICGHEPGPDCKEGNGATYRGPTSTTAQGVTCQAWRSQYPHRHISFTPQTHPDKGLDSNSCRNPDNDTQGLWCYTTDRNKKWDFCQIPDCDCKEGNGATYRGPTFVTKLGVNCQAWRSQHPHRHVSFTPQTHPDQGLESNNCRNPDNDGQGPWCYTTDRNKKWDYCQIPDCEL